MTRKAKPSSYLPRLLEHAQRANLQPGTVSHVSIYHDKWCAIFKGGCCNCAPVLKDGKPRVA